MRIFSKWSVEVNLCLRSRPRWKEATQSEFSDENTSYSKHSAIANLFTILRFEDTTPGQLTETSTLARWVQLTQMSPVKRLPEGLSTGDLKHRTHVAKEHPMNRSLARGLYGLTVAALFIIAPTTPPMAAEYGATVSEAAHPARLEADAASSEGGNSVKPDTIELPPIIIKGGSLPCYEELECCGDYDDCWWAYIETTHPQEP